MQKKKKWKLAVFCILLADAAENAMELCGVNGVEEEICFWCGPNYYLISNQHTECMKYHTVHSFVY